MITYETTFANEEAYVPKMPIIAEVIESEKKIMSTTAILEQICEVYKTDVTDDLHFGMSAASEALWKLTGDTDTKVSPEAVEHASQIKKHFAHKYFQKIIKNEPLTQWQSKAYKLLSDMELNVLSNDEEERRCLSLLATLPTFYAEDVAFNALESQYQGLAAPTKYNPSVEVEELKFVTRLDHHQKTNRRMAFVFEDQNGNLVYFRFEYNYQICKFFSSCIRNNKIVVSGTTQYIPIHKTLPAFEIRDWTIHHDKY